MNMNIISKYLQFLRKSNNYTQDDLAKEIGISRQAVSKWENGTTIPNLEVLLKISKLYDMMLGSKAQLPNLATKIKFIAKNFLYLYKNNKIQCFNYL